MFSLTYHDSGFLPVVLIIVRLEIQLS